MHLLFDIFTLHYAPMRPALVRLAYRLLQDRDEAEDVVQDIMLQLYERRDQFPIRGADETFVKRMVRNRCIDRLRQMPPDTPLEDENDSPPPEPIVDSFEKQFEAADYLTHLLNGIPQPARKIVELRLLDDLSFEEIEKQTGISAGNARVILSRTLKKMRL